MQACMCKNSGKTCWRWYAPSGSIFQLRVMANGQEVFWLGWLRTEEPRVMTSTHPIFLQWNICCEKEPGAHSVHEWTEAMLDHGGGELKARPTAVYSISGKPLPCFHSHPTMLNLPAHLLQYNIKLTHIQDGQKNIDVDKSLWEHKVSCSSTVKHNIHPNVQKIA